MKKQRFTMIDMIFGGMIAIAIFMFIEKRQANNFLGSVSELYFEDGFDMFIEELK